MMHLCIMFYTYWTPLALPWPGFPLIAVPWLSPYNFTLASLVPGLGMHLIALSRLAADVLCPLAYLTNPVVCLYFRRYVVGVHGLRCDALHRLWRSSQ